jgi:AcrR family transcriptional regulator
LEKKERMKMHRKERETLLRKEIILEAAEKLFLKQGYDKTTMDEIAAVSEFSKGTLYNYFASKDELYLAMGSKAYEIIIEYTKKLTKNEEPGIEQLKAVGYAYYEFTKDYPNYAHIFHDIFIKMPNLDKKTADELTAIEAEYLEKNEAYSSLFKELIIQAIKSKQIRSDKDPILIGFTLFMVTSGIMKELEQHRATIKEGKFNSDEIIDFIFEMIADGLKPRGN